MFIYRKVEGCTNLEEESKTFQPLFVLKYSYQLLISEFLWIEINFCYKDVWKKRNGNGGIFKSIDTINFLLG